MERMESRVPYPRSGAVNRLAAFGLRSDPPSNTFFYRIKRDIMRIRAPRGFWPKALTPDGRLHERFLISEPFNFGYKIRVLCVDDCADFPKLLGWCIDAESDMEQVGAMSDANNLGEMVERTGARVVLLDMTMPGRDPLSAAAGLLSGELLSGRTVRVIAFSGRTDQEMIDAAKAAGCIGYLNKDAPVPTVLRAIREAAGVAAPFQVWL